MMISEMGLFRSIERRHIGSGGDRTTIALEPEFWNAADRQAEAQGINWQQWVAMQLEDRPESYGRASWLRVSILKGKV